MKLIIALAVTCPIVYLLIGALTAAITDKVSYSGVDEPAEVAFVTIFWPAFAFAAVLWQLYRFFRWVIR